jgi:hypothetical protein
MKWFYSSSGLSKERVAVLLKFSLSSCFLAAAAVYVLVRIIFFEITNSIGEDILIILKTAAVATLLGLSICTLLIAVEWIDRLLKKLPRVTLAKPVGWATILLIAGSLFMYSCNGQTKLVAGVKKDLTTGLTATYKNLEPENVVLVMNGEELNHTDIPIGESFLLINKNIKGFKEKQGKVSVGCSLVITDKKGKKILEAADLFQGRDTFNKQEVNYLKCTINTGEPMEWEEKYNVVATFWDKYGDGKIVNKVTIRMIDIP